MEPMLSPFDPLLETPHYLLKKESIHPTLRSVPTRVSLMYQLHLDTFSPHYLTLHFLTSIQPPMHGRWSSLSVVTWNDLSKGFDKEEGIDYNETYSPTVRFESG